MNNEKLLDDVLLDDQTVLFREELRTRCLKKLSRPRWPWIAVPAAAAFLLILLRLLYWPSPTAPDYLVSTVPLSADQRVTTPSSLAPFRVERSFPVERIDDEQLLALFSPAPCGLVGDKLIFFDPEDRERHVKDLGG